MTRIFDALRKSRAHGPPPAPPVHPAPEVRPATPFAIPAAHVSTAAAPLSRAVASPLPALAVLEAQAPMGGEILQEMSALRVHIESALADRSRRKVMLMGAQGGEGTTTVAAQFATALSRDDSLRVLIVDAHVLRPSLSDLCGPGRGSLPPIAARQALYGGPPDPARADRLRVLPLAEESRRTRSISHQDLRQLLEAAEASFDWIVVDGPPVLESPDAAAFAALADGVVLVVQAGRTKRPVLARSVEILRNAGARVLGTVLNRRRLEIPGFIYHRV